jgi:2',3'-cyclic-nucleotide 2'-phosphodiesterase (5'-nucleotidase family)
VEAEKGKGPVLLLDAGNALFKSAGQDELALRQRAELILSAMGELGTAAMAVGERDLNAGLEFLKKTAARARVPLLSANLLGTNGKPAFSSIATTSIGSVKVGLIGISPLSANGKLGLRAAPPVPSALSAARKLKGKVDVIIALAAIPYADALQLAKEAGSAIDLILQSHEARGTGIAQGNGLNFVIPTGERGRQLGRLELDLSGTGPIVDRGQVDRNRQALVFLDRQILATQQRSEAASSPEMKKSLAEALRGFEARRRTLAQDLTPGEQKPGRSLALTFVTLGAEMSEDPTLKARVEKLEPPGSVPDPAH